MDLYDVMRTTPASREFTADPVPDAVLHRILDHARFAPSGGNRQGWRVIVIRDRETRVRVRELYQLGWREYVAHVAAGLVPFAPGPDGRWNGPAVDLDEARRTERPFPFADRLEDVPVMMILCAQLGALAVTDNGLDRQSIVGGASVYPFAHNILLAARNEGLGGIMTTVICRQEPALRSLLRIPPGVAIAGLVALGRPVRSITRLRRDPVDAFTTVDSLDGEPFSG